MKKSLINLLGGIALTVSTALSCASTTPKPEVPKPVSDYCEIVQPADGEYLGRIEDELALFKIDQKNNLCSLTSHFWGVLGAAMDYDCNRKMDSVYIALVDKVYPRSEIPEKDNAFFTQEYFDNILEKGYKLACSKNKLGE